MGELDHPYSLLLLYSFVLFICQIISILFFFPFRAIFYHYDLWKCYVQKFP